MSDGSAIAPIWMPPADVWAKLGPGARVITLALLLWRDGRGSCDPTEKDLAALLGVGVSTVRKHAKEVAEAEIAVRERRRREDNSLGGYRYWLDLEKLGLAGGDRSNPAVGPAVDSPAEPSAKIVDGTAQIERSGVDNPGADRSNPAVPTAQIERSHARVTRGGARARVLSNPIPPSFAFRDDEQKDFMEAVASACGPGLCRFDECEGLVDSLAIAMDKWLVVEGFDADLDIVPTLKRLTAHKRARPIYDFGVAWITDDIRAHRDARLTRETKRAAKAVKEAAGIAPRRRGPPGELDRFLAKGRAEDHARRVSTLRSTIARLEAGDGQDFDLPKSERGLDGQWRDDAFAQALQRAREELAGLTAMEAEGAGNGEA